ncbi:hypothetical protein V8E36_000875 [Tilletia maclaganii]
MMMLFPANPPGVLQPDQRTASPAATTSAPSRAHTRAGVRGQTAAREAQERAEFYGLSLQPASATFAPAPPATDEHSQRIFVTALTREQSWDADHLELHDRVQAARTSLMVARSRTRSTNASGGGQRNGRSSLDVAVRVTESLSKRLRLISGGAWARRSTQLDAAVVTESSSASTTTERSPEDSALPAGPQHRRPPLVGATSADRVTTPPSREGQPDGLPRGSRSVLFERSSLRQRTLTAFSKLLKRRPPIVPTTVPLETAEASRDAVPADASVSTTSSAAAESPRASSTSTPKNRIIQSSRSACPNPTGAGGGACVPWPAYTPRFPPSSDPQAGPADTSGVLGSQCRSILKQRRAADAGGNEADGGVAALQETSRVSGNADAIEPAPDGDSAVAVSLTAERSSGIKKAVRINSPDSVANTERVSPPPSPPVQQQRGAQIRMQSLTTAEWIAACEEGLCLPPPPSAPRSSRSTGKRSRHHDDENDGQHSSTVGSSDSAPLQPQGKAESRRRSISETAAILLLSSKGYAAAAAVVGGVQGQGQAQPQPPRQRPAPPPPLRFGRRSLDIRKQVTRLNVPVRFTKKKAGAGPSPPPTTRVV